ncbi:MAG: hypothetical protein QOI66_4583, partial [Myxococcales bacterium]|nr:hypothetical protein [Myxococcales bacterium]
MTKRGLGLISGACMTLGLLGCTADSGSTPPAGSGGSSATGSGGSSATGSGGSSGGSGGSGSGGSDGSGGAPATGSGGNVGGGDGGPGGSDGGPVVDPNGDTPPWRPLNVTAAKMRLSHSFRASAADPAVSFNDNSEVSAVDPRSPKMVGKLVLPLGGLGSTAGTLGNEGPFVLPRGYHVLGIAVYENYNILHCDAGFFGDARRQVFDGMQHTTKYDFAGIKMGVSDGLAKRTEMALKYLDKM